MEQDPFYDPDGGDHLLFATGYQLDALGLPGPDGPDGSDPREGEGGIPGVDQDTLGRAGFERISADDLETIRAREVDRARGTLGVIADGRADPAGDERGQPDPERETPDDPPRSGADSARGGPDSGLPTDPDELARVIHHLTNPKSAAQKRPTKAQAGARRSFKGCTFACQYKGLKGLATGEVEIVVVAEFGTRAEALKMLDTPGLLLEAAIKPRSARKHDA